MTLTVVRARPRAALGIALVALLAPLALGVAGCASKGGAKTQAVGTSKAAKTTEKAMSTAPVKEPDHIRVQT